jgi:uncharacterized SAM-binding protein YcdF (DUF218 family)
VRRSASSRPLNLGIVLAAAVLFASPAASAPDLASERVQALTALAVQAYWTGGDPKAAESLLKGVTLHGRYDIVQRAFAEASALAPDRLDLRFDVASAQILRKDLAGARASYAQILARDPASFEAYAWLAALARVEGDQPSATGAETALAALDRARAGALRRRFNRADEIMADPLDATVRPLPGGVTIVALGFALNPSGGMEKPLLDRLAATLAAARANPSARIIVTGGQPQSGVTEADLMTRWLVQNGVDRDRIQIEDKAKDTVGNAVNAAGLISQARPDKVILVTSAGHMRRGRAVTEAALQEIGIDAPVIPLVASSGVAAELQTPVTPDERLAIYRDVVRTFGIWSYPGLQP